MSADEGNLEELAITIEDCKSMNKKPSDGTRRSKKRNRGLPSKTRQPPFELQLKNSPSVSESQSQYSTSFSAAQWKTGHTHRTTLSAIHTPSSSFSATGDSVRTNPVFKYTLEDCNLSDDLKAGDWPKRKTRSERYTGDSLIHFTTGIDFNLSCVIPQNVNYSSNNSISANTPEIRYFGKKGKNID